MTVLLKPRALKPGDVVASISLSWGGPYEYKERYLYGKEQLQEYFKLQVKEASHALSAPNWLAENPLAKAQDLHQCLVDPEIKGVFSTIGGEDAYKIIPFIDLQIIRNNPKIFIGYSDTTVLNFVFNKAGVVSFYGPSIMSGFGENGGLHEYLIQGVKKTIFSNQVVGKLYENSEGWVANQYDWADKKMQNIKRPLFASAPWNYIQGNKIVQGKLLGGCTETLETIKNSAIWPSLDEWQDVIFFLENSENAMSTNEFENVLTSYGDMGIIQKIKGLLFGRPGGSIVADKFNEYDQIILKICKKFGRTDLPVVTQMDFGHTDPMMTIPVSVIAEIDPKLRKIKVLESCCW